MAPLVRARWATVRAQWRTARAPRPTPQIARILARMGAALAPEPDAPVSEASRDLRDLQVARTGLVKERTRLRNRGQTRGNRVLRRQTRTRLALARAADQGTGRDRSRNASPRTRPWRAGREILRRVPGLGQVAAAASLSLARRGRSGRSDLTACPRHPVRAALIRDRHDGTKAGRQPCRSGPAPPRVRAMEGHVVRRENAASPVRSCKSGAFAAASHPGSFSCPSHSAAGANPCATPSPCPPSWP